MYLGNDLTIVEPTFRYIIQYNLCTNDIESKETYFLKALISVRQFKVFD